MKLVIIDWEDSASHHQVWTNVNTLKESKPTMCRSVGWLLYNGQDCKVIASHIGEDEVNAGGDMIIPAKAIKKITVLRKGKK